MASATSPSLSRVVFRRITVVLAALAATVLLAPAAAIAAPADAPYSATVTVSATDEAETEQRENPRAKATVVLIFDENGDELQKAIPSIINNCTYSWSGPCERASRSVPKPDALIGTD